MAAPASWGGPISTLAAVEAMPAGCVAVVDAMGVTDAGSSAIPYVRVCASTRSPD
jgi:hypothetical protein